MEQLVSRLDLAMFNAILRESAEEMPMDPVSDPISDSKVLPIPAGKSGFAAGAQLKNAVSYGTLLSYAFFLSKHTKLVIMFIYFSPVRLGSSVPQQYALLRLRELLADQRRKVFYDVLA